jgi:hypothetical protein
MDNSQGANGELRTHNSVNRLNEESPAEKVKPDYERWEDIHLVNEGGWRQFLRSFGEVLARCEAAFVVTVAAVAWVGISRIGNNPPVTQNDLLMTAITQGFLVAAMTIWVVIKR